MCVLAKQTIKILFNFPQKHEVLIVTARSSLLTARTVQQVQ